MANDEGVFLSSEIEELIRIHYAPQAQSAVRAILLSYAVAGRGPVTDRVQFDLLHLGAGDPDRVKRLRRPRSTGRAGRDEPVVFLGGRKVLSACVG